MPLVRGHYCPIASIGCQIALTKTVHGWMGSSTDGCHCMHARARPGRRRRRRVCMSSAGSVIHARAAACRHHRRRPATPIPQPLTVRHPASQDHARVPWTARTTTTCVPADNNDDDDRSHGRSARAGRRRRRRPGPRARELASFLSVNQSNLLGVPSNLG